MSTPMPTSHDDLSKYLPDEATANAATEEAATYDKEISRPELLERLARLKTNPDLLKAAPESVQAYVPPTAVPDRSDPTLPHARVQVAVAAPPRPQELPTMPALKRLAEEHHVQPGAVEGGALQASKSAPRTPAATTPRPSVRALVLGVLAVLAVLLPLLVVILLFVKPQQDADAKSLGTAATSATVAVTATAATAAAPSAAPRLPASIAPAPETSSAAPRPAPKSSGKSVKPNLPAPPPSPNMTTRASAAPASAPSAPAVPSATSSATPAPAASTPSKWF
jgi:hypothetical protein